MWTEGILEINGVKLNYWVKHYEKGSVFGIDGGRISKLEIRVDGKTTVNYDRGWDIRPMDKVSKTAYEQLLEKYN